MRPLALLAAAAALAAGGCSAQPPQTEAAPAPVQPKERPMEVPPPQATPVSDLPFAQGMSFNTLDEYLEHLRRRGAYGVPYYREVRPGLYERITGRRTPGQAGAEPITREDLARRYGFSR